MKAEKSKLYILIVAALLSIPFIFQMAGTFQDQPWQIPRWLQLALATIVQFFLGMELYQQASSAWRKRSLNVELFLVIILSIIYIYNAAVVLNGWTLPLYFEMNVLTVTFTLFGSWLLTKSHEKGAQQFSEALFQTLADKAVQVYLGIIILVSLLSFLFWWLARNQLDRGIVSAFDVWIVACPSALALAIPTTLAVGRAVAGRIGSIFQLELSQEIYRKIRQNLIFAFAFPFLGIPFAAFGWLTPILVDATLLMSLFAIMVNTLLLYLWLPKNIQGA